MSGTRVLTKEDIALAWPAHQMALDQGIGVSVNLMGRHFQATETDSSDV